MNEPQMVYVVQRCYSGEGCDLEGVFSTEKGARDHVENIRVDCPSASIDIVACQLDVPLP